jgi:hypothetical protein
MPEHAALHGGLELLAGERLHQIIKDTKPQAGHGAGEVVATGGDHDGRVRIRPPHLLRQPESVVSWHAQIGYEHSWRGAPHLRECRIGIGGDPWVIAGRLEPVCAQSADGWFIINDNDVRHGLFTFG